MFHSELLNTPVGRLLLVSMDAAGIRVRWASRRAFRYRQALRPARVETFRLADCLGRLTASRDVPGGPSWKGSQNSSMMSWLPRDESGRLAVVLALVRHRKLPFRDWSLPRELVRVNCAEFSILARCLTLDRRVEAAKNRRAA